jgi:hemerythrin-like domain-containing protein
MINIRELRQKDPIKRNVEKDLEQVENSPMDPPEAYAESTVEKVPYEKMPKHIQELMDEHNAAKLKLNDFEKALTQFKEQGYKLDNEINRIFTEFFEFFDNNLLEHNYKEERKLFPLLTEKLITAGEHSNGPEKHTAVDIMEDDHVKFIQLGSLTFNLIGLATRLKDFESRMVTFDFAYETGRELIELLRLHIFREDETIFPLAYKLISEEEFKSLEK